MNKGIVFALGMSMLALASTAKASYFEVSIEGIFDRPRQPLSIDRTLLMSPTIEGARYATHLLSKYSYLDLRDALAEAAVKVDVTPPYGKSRHTGVSLYDDCMEDNYGNHRLCATKEAARVYNRAKSNIRSLNDLNFFWGQMREVKKSYFSNNKVFFNPTDPLPGITHLEADNVREAYRLLVAAGEDAYEHPTRLQSGDTFHICSMATRLAIEAGEKEGAGLWGKLIDMAGPVGSLMSGDIPTLLKKPQNFNGGIGSYIEYAMILAQRAPDGRPILYAGTTLDLCLIQAREEIINKAKRVREANRLAKSAAMGYNGGSSTAGAAITLMTPEMVEAMHNRAQSFIPRAYQLYEQRYGKLDGVRFTNLPVLVGSLRDDGRLTTQPAEVRAAPTAAPTVRHPPAARQPAEATSKDYDPVANILGAQ